TREVFHAEIGRSLAPAALCAPTTTTRPAGLPPARRVPAPPAVADAGGAALLVRPAGPREVVAPRPAKRLLAVARANLDARGPGLVPCGLRPHCAEACGGCRRDGRAGDAAVGVGRGAWAALRGRRRRSLLPIGACADAFLRRLRRVGFLARTRAVGHQEAL